MTDYVVVLHSSGVGGYVVRPRHDGWIPQPYTDAEVLKAYKTQRGAQAWCDKLNGY